MARREFHSIFCRRWSPAHYCMEVQVGDLTGPIESYQVVRLPVSPVTAVPSTSPASGPFHWNSVADGGGFTFTYHVNNPDNAAIPDTTIALDWAIGTTPDDEIPFGLAYSFAIDSEDLKSPGDHTITVSQSQLQPFGNPSPLTVGGQPAPYLLEVVDPDHLLGGQAPNEQLRPPRCSAGRGRGDGRIQPKSARHHIL